MFAGSRIRLLAVGMLALFVSACAGVKVPQDQQSGSSGSQTGTGTTASAQALPLTGTMRVALLAPLSGDLGPLGQQLVNAAALALFEKPEASVEVLPFDTRGTPEGAAQAAAEARGANVDLVVGPLFGSHLPTVQQAFLGQPQPILAFTNNTQLAGGSTFVMGLSVNAQVTHMVDFLGSQGKNRVVVIGPEGVYTDRVIEATDAALAATGGTLVNIATYPDDADFNAIAAKVQDVTGYPGRRQSWASYEKQLIARVRSAGDPAGFLSSEAARFGTQSVRGRMLSGLASAYRSFAGSGRNRALAETVSRIEGVDAMPVTEYDALMLPIGDDNLVAIGSMLDLYNAGRGFAVLTGTNVWSNLRLSSEPSLIGGWYTDSSEPQLSPFLQAYRSNYQETPEAIAVLGYHAARVALEAYASGNRPGATFVRRGGGFNGLAGTVSFGDDNIMRHPLSIYQVNPEGPQELPASGRPGS